MFGSHKRGIAPLATLDREKILPEKNQIAERLAEHFHQPLSIQGTTDQSVLDSIRQRPTMRCGNETANIAKFLTALSMTEETNALGQCGIPAEI